MSTARTRREAARLANLLVIALSCCAALTWAFLVRSYQDDARAGDPTTSSSRGGERPAAAGPPASAIIDESLPRIDSATAAGDDRLEALPSRGARRAAIEDLRARLLTLPVAGVNKDQLVAAFDSPRGGAAHEAIDILAPRGTPVVAVESGRIVKLFTSERGGLTVYQFDSLDRFTYYYAHLDRYADGLSEGTSVRRGQTLGYVGTTGNAPEGTPHLHFAIFELGPEKHWWQGQAIDPYLVWHSDDDSTSRAQD